MTAHERLAAEAKRREAKAAEILTGDCGHCKYTLGDEDHEAGCPFKRKPDTPKKRAHSEEQD